MNYSSPLSSSYNNYSDKLPTTRGNKIPWIDIALIVGAIALFALASTSMALGYFIPSLVGFGLGGLILGGEALYRIIICCRGRHHANHPSNSLKNTPSTRTDPHISLQTTSTSSDESDKDTSNSEKENNHSYVNITNNSISPNINEVKGNEQIDESDETSSDELGSSDEKEKKSPRFIIIPKSEDMNTKNRFFVPKDKIPLFAFIDSPTIKDDESNNTTSTSSDDADISSDDEFSDDDMHDPVRSSPNRENSKIDYNTTVYSPYSKAEEKMNKQLALAIKAGKDEKPGKLQLTEEHLKKDVSSLIDTEIDDPAAGAATIEGPPPRKYEDVHFVKSIALTINDVQVKAQLAVVCDGHNDKGQAGQMLKEELGEAIEKELHGFDEESVGNAITKLMVEFNKKWINAKNGGGTTVTGTLIFEDRIYVFNVGDSRTILSTSKGCYQLSEDAKPDEERFKRAIEKKGYWVKEKRVGGRFGSAVARDIGIDMLSSRPKITRIWREEKQDSPYCPNGSYLILACDGLWDVASTEEVHEAIQQMAKNDRSPKEMAAHLVNRAVEHGSTDDITVVVVKVE